MPVEEIRAREAARSERIDPPAAADGPEARKADTADLLNRAAADALLEVAIFDRKRNRIMKNGTKMNGEVLNGMEEKYLKNLQSIFNQSSIGVE